MALRGGPRGFDDSSLHTLPVAPSLEVHNSDSLNPIFTKSGDQVEKNQLEILYEFGVLSTLWGGILPHHELHKLAHMKPFCV